MEPLFYRLFQEHRERLEAARGLLVSYSGGPDSTFLLHWLKACKERLAQGSKELRLILVHFDHGLRPESTEEAERCREWALGEEFHLIEGFSCDPKANLQEQARGWRRSHLLRLAEEWGCDLILTGHQASDLIETQMFRLLRGVSLFGLDPLPTLDPPWFRPLLGLSKRQIEDFLLKRKIPFLEDPSNQDPRFSRSRLRAELLPLLEELSPGDPAEKFRALAQEARELDELFEAYVKPEWIRAESLPYSLVTSLPRLLAKELIHRFLLHKGAREIRRSQLEEFLSLIESGRGDWRLDLKGMSLIGRKGRVWVG